MSQTEAIELPECPFADISVQPSEIKATSCPFHDHKAPKHYHIDHPVPLAIRQGSHQVSEGTAKLLKDIGGGDRIREFTTRFYARAFLDYTLKPFFFMEDGATAHGKRLADWIIQKMGGEGEPWTESGRLGMRQPSHHAAWNNKKRHPSVRGQHFQLDDARAWMRIHFWAARECGLHEHEAFWQWYISFIEHFIAVYERRAPRYVEEDAAWSANPANIEFYESNNRKMIDVIGVGRSQF